jgi:hypothetical protein
VNLLEADCAFRSRPGLPGKNIELGLCWLAAIREQSGWDARLVVTGPPGPHNPTNAAYLEQLFLCVVNSFLDGAAHLSTKSRTLSLKTRR